MSVHAAETALLQSFGQLDIQNKPQKHQSPLLKLSRVVLLECIEHLDYLEIILFSLLSKRAKTIAKFIRWNPLTVLLKANSQSAIQLRCSINPGRIWEIVYEKKDASSGYSYIKSILAGPRVFYCLTLRDHENAIEDSKQMTEHICEVFRSPISGIEIAEESFIEWLIKFQPTIRCVTIRKNVVTSVETLYRVLNNLIVTEYFWLGSIAIDENFQYLEPIPYRSIAIKDSSWVGLPSILNGINSIICLFESNLTAEDINTILKEWQMRTKLQNLDYLRIDICTLLDAGIFIETAVKRLEVTLSDGNDGRPTKVKIHGEYIIKLPHINRVRNFNRSDGMIGSILIGYKVNELEKRTVIYFHFQVWSKQA